MEITPTSNQLATPVTPQHSANTSPDLSGVKFAQAMGSAVTVAGQMAAKVSGAGGLGAGPLAAAVGGSSGGGSVSGSADGTAELNSLLQQQEAIQLQSEEFSSLSNISKTQHDTRMNAIGNMKS